MKINLLKNYRTLSIEVKTSLWFMICNIIQKGIAYITVPIFTRLLTDIEYGTYSLYLSWESIFSIFATLNLGYQVFNNGMSKYSDDRDGYALSMVGLTAVSGIIFTLVYVFFKHPFEDWVGSVSTFLPVMAADMFFTASIGIWIVRQRYEYRYKSITIVSIARIILNPALGILFVLISSSKINGRIFSIIVSNAILFVPVLYLLLKKSRRIIAAEYWKYALKLSLPLIPHYLSMVVLSSCDRIMIGSYCGEAYTAYYSIANNTAMIMQIIFTGIRTTLEPWIYQRLKATEYSRINNVSSSLLLLVAALNLLPVLFAPEIISILGSTAYAQAAGIMPMLSCSVFMIYLYSLFVNIELFYEKNKLTSIGSAGAALANIILNIIFIPRFGYEAAAYTTLVCYILLALFHYIVVRSICRKQGISSDIYNTRLMLILSAAIIAASFGIRLLYGYSIIRYAIIFAMGVILILLRKKILAVLKNIKK